MEYGLIGEKLGHSYSPMIHAQLADYDYVLREVPPEKLDALMRQKDFKGINITIPYKKSVIPYCAELSETAKEIGSVNTIVVRPDGTLWGHNTDVGGFIYMLHAAHIDPSGKKCIILGSGGTSLTAQTALKRLDACEVIVVSRQGPVTYEDLYRFHTDAEILVNATPVGMYPHNGVSPVDLNRLPMLKGVADVVYNPEKTALILDAEMRGIPHVSGLSMLVAQAHEAAEFFSGVSIASDRIEEICAQIRADTLSLVLIGMPGSGKSTLGRKVAERMNRPFIDADEEIIRRERLTIPEIFARYGEAYFRKVESEVLADICRKGGQVISTGGGAILKPENVRALRQNARVCLIQRDLTQLPVREGRPLSSSMESILKLWEERKDKYAAAADFSIVNDAEIEDAARHIQEAFYEAAHH